MAQHAHDKRTVFLKEKSWFGATSRAISQRYLGLDELQDHAVKRRSI